MPSKRGFTGARVQAQEVGSPGCEEQTLDMVASLALRFALSWQKVPGVLMITTTGKLCMSRAQVCCAFQAYFLVHVI